MANHSLKRWASMKLIQTAGAALLVLPTAAVADEFDKVIRYTCDPKADMVTIDYSGSFAVDKNRAKPDQKRSIKDAWDPWSLVILDESRDFVKGIQKIERRCSLSDGRYDVTIAPMPGNSNLNGNCGAWVSATVRVARSGKDVLNAQFEKSCNDFDSPVITRIRVRAGAAPPEKTEISPKEFYRYGA